MRPFRFRPQPALDLRLRQLDAAEQALSRARADVRQAEESVQAAEAAMRAAEAQGANDWQAPNALLRLEWHRNWMVGLERDAARLRQELEARRTVERRAAEIAREARKQVKVLERLKARLLREWQLEARRHEQKALDELASLRFASRQRAGIEENR
jgi:flagellar export protein FliJ